MPQQQATAAAAAAAAAANMCLNERAEKQQQPRKAGMQKVGGQRTRKNLRPFLPPPYLLWFVGLLRLGVRHGEEGSAQSLLAQARRLIFF